jgi:hypothetical protein
VKQKQGEKEMEEKNGIYATFEDKCRCGKGWMIGRNFIVKHGKMFCDEECLRIFEECELAHQDLCFCGDPDCETPHEPHNGDNRLL